MMSQLCLAIDSFLVSLGQDETGTDTHTQGQTDRQTDFFREILVTLHSSMAIQRILQTRVLGPRVDYKFGCQVVY